MKKLSIYLAAALCCLSVTQAFATTAAKKQDVNCGDSVLISVKPNYGYHFDRWNDGDKNLPRKVYVTEAATYIAYFAKDTFNIKFYDWDKTTTIKDTNEAYLDPIIAPDDLAQRRDQHYTYDFRCWLNEYNECFNGGDTERDSVFFAVFDSTVNQYKITFANWDSSYLCDDKWDFGVAPIYCDYPNVPTKQEDPQYTYTFIGWGDDLVTKPVWGDTTYVAQYQANLRDYHIFFNNYDGTLLLDTVVYYGYEPIYTRQTPTKPANPHYTYTFIGWENTGGTRFSKDESLPDVGGTETYTAVFDSTVNRYTVTLIVEPDTLDNNACILNLAGLTDSICWLDDHTCQGVFDYNDETPLSVMAHEDGCYTFEQWLMIDEDGNRTYDNFDVLTPEKQGAIYNNLINEKLDIYVTGNITLRAIFSRNVYTITVDVDDPIHGQPVIWDAEGY